jgi:hypothetical protein
MFALYKIPVYSAFGLDKQYQVHVYNPDREINLLGFRNFIHGG